MAPEGHGEHGSHGDGHGKDEQHHDEDPHSGEDPKHQGGSSGGGDGSVNPRDGEAERKRKADMDAINGGLDSGKQDCLQIFPALENQQSISVRRSTRKSKQNSSKYEKRSW